MRLGFTAAALFTFGTAAPGQLPAITGDYGLAGTGSGGKYTGTASIVKIGGEMYRAKWTIGTRVFSGVCFREQQSLSCASCTAPQRPTVLSYLAGAKGLDGVWFEGGGTQLGKVTLTPKGYRAATNEIPGSKGQMNPVTLAGQFEIKGTNPAKSAYSGTASVRQVVAVSPSAYYFDWTVGSSIMHGAGGRDAAGTPIVAAQCSKRTESLGLVYAIDIKGRILTGAWTQDISGAVTVGTETMTKWK